VHLALQLLFWLVALAWFSRSFAAWRGLPSIANLLLSEYDAPAPGDTTLTVIVPARNEERDIRACLQSLLAQDCPNLTLLAVDDRSTDATGAIMDEIATAHPQRLRVLHLRELPPQWLGKTHAMALAARETTADYVLFTDADIVFAPSALRRALAYAVRAQADHLVLMPTTIIRRWDEAALLSFFQIFGLWAVRPWKVADPRARRDAIGVGAFNLLRRAAYEAVGGFEALRMEIVEDLGMARRIKQAALRQRVAFGRGLVSVHWAAGVPGLVGVMIKNVFAAVRFQVPLLLAGCLWLTAFCILPFINIWTPGLVLPSAVTILSLAWAYRLMGRVSGISAWNWLLAPFAAAVFVFTMLRSMALTLRQGGVVWRGTFYSLAELRDHAARLP
jgi:glycosyltransferase involved in cell wall biosynthesis